MQVVWTKQAEDSFNEILDYLMKVWTVKEANNFIDLVNHIVFQISKTPQLFKKSIFDDKSREDLITKQTSLFYRQKHKNIIEIEYFWNNYRNPNILESVVKNK